MKFAAFLLAWTATASAADRCPWLSAATAAGALGGEVAVAVAGQSCTFTRKDRPVELRIELTSAERCPASADRIRGIGNEAVACFSGGELVVSRVRQQPFWVRISGGKPGEFREKAHKIAELVAGFLF